MRRQVPGVGGTTGPGIRRREQPPARETAPPPRLRAPRIRKPVPEAQTGSGRQRQRQRPRPGSGLRPGSGPTLTSGPGPDTPTLTSGPTPDTPTPTLDTDTDTDTRTETAGASHGAGGTGTGRAKPPETRRRPCRWDRPRGGCGRRVPGAFASRCGDRRPARHPARRNVPGPGQGPRGPHLQDLRGLVVA